MFSVLYMKTLTDIQHQLYQVDRLLDLGKFDRADIMVDRNTATTGLALHRDVASDTTYADDSGFVTLLEDNKDVPNAIRKFITAIHLGLRKYALTPSYDEGKSQVLVSLNGPSQRAASSTLYGTMKKQVDIPELDLTVKMVTVAKHLGGMVDCHNDLGPEIKYRQVLTSQAATPLRNSLYLYKQIPTKQLVYTADSLAKSRLLYKAEIWPDGTVHQNSKLHGTYIKLNRDALGIQQKDQSTNRITDTEVLAQADRLDLSDVLRRQRMN